MSDKQTITHASFTIEKTYAVSPERVFRGFANPETKKRWYGARDPMTTERFEMDFRAGGIDHMVYRFGKGMPLPEGTKLSYETRYQNIVVNARIIWVYTMSINDQVASSSQASIELLPKGKGTEMVFTEQGAYVEHADGAQMREGGWKQLFERLNEELAR
jgi:uncharacterized protein YndB with AHSA1/START domain